MASKRPNVIVICTDQMRADALGCTGNTIARTPNIDRIARDGATFTHHLTPCQICAPSRASMFSGLYPRHHGLARNGLALSPSVELMTHVMMEAGVRTHGVGKLHFQPILAPAAYGMPDSNAFWTLPESEGWHGPFYGMQTVDLVIGESFASVRGGHYGRWLERYHPDIAELYRPENALDAEPDPMEEVWRSAVPADKHYNSWIADRAIAFLDRVDADTPFFLFVSFPDPHHPFSPPQPYCDNFRPEDMPMPRFVDGELDAMPDYIGGETWMEGDGATLSYKEFLERGGGTMEQGTWQRTDAFSTSSMAKIIAYTHAMNQMIDDNVGRILSALDAQGRRDNTFVLFTSDHGELLGDHGLIRKGPMPYQVLLHVPFLIRGPGIEPGSRIEAMTSHLDVKDTLLDVMGLAGEAGDGTTMTPLLAGTADRIRDHFIAEYHPRAVDRQYNQSIIRDGARLTIYPAETTGRWGEFFDLEEDPYEHRNRYSDPACGARIQALRRVLEREMPPRAEVPGRVLGTY